MTKQEFPAMQFYPDSWLSGRATRLMTAEQRGAYIDLLAHAWMGNPACTVPDSNEELALLAGVPLARWKKIGAKVREQFQPVEDHPGLLRNSKQFAVYLRMAEFRKIKSQAGSRGAAKRWQDDGKGNGKRDGKADGEKCPPSLGLGPSPSPVESKQKKNTPAASAREAPAPEAKAPMTESQWLVKLDQVAKWCNTKRGKQAPGDPEWDVEFESRFGLAYEDWLELNARCREFYSTHTEGDFCDAETTDDPDPDVHHLPATTSAMA